MKYLRLTLFFLLSLLAACSNVIEKKGWSENIPPQSYYLDYYAQDIEHQEVLSEKMYLLWIHRFYFGWELYQRGWQRATDELLASLDGDDQEYAEQMMFTIGKLVSAEWAKNRDFRVINTRHLSLWGNTLKLSVGASEQIIILEKILWDVELLLAGDIDPRAIKDSRYYQQEPFVTESGNLDF